MVVPTTAIVVMMGNYLGVFNLLEWAVRDEFFRLRPHTAIDPATVVVTIDETDLKQVGDWPIPDQALADLLKEIRAQQPRVIGMDLYRDIPKEPGNQQLEEVFQTTPNLIGVEKITGDRVAPPPKLKAAEQVGLADLVLDADRKVRRGLLTAQDAQDGKMDKAGLATFVALEYLKAEGLVVKPVDENDPNKLQLGRAIFTPLRNQEASYLKNDLGGYQILMNWWGDERAYRRVTMRDVLAGKIPADLMRDRMVFIGSTAASTNDFFGTPYSSSWFSDDEQTPGVIIHANLASQIVHGALAGRPLLRGFSVEWQWIWILSWATIGSGGSWYFTSRYSGRRQGWGGKTFWSTIAASGMILGGGYGIFLQGLLIPVVPSLVALAASVIATTQIYKQQKLEDTNFKLATANHQLVNHSKILEQKVLERMQELEKAKLAADAANQAKSDFLANMSHELRTPLNGVLGYTQILQSTEPLTENGLKGVGVIHQCGSHLLTLINDILDLSKIEARKFDLYPNDLNLKAFLLSVSEICRIRAEQKGVSFTMTLADNLPGFICAEEKRLRQILINLLGNAIKFTDRGGVQFQVSVLAQTAKPQRVPLLQPETIVPKSKWISQFKTKLAQYLQLRQSGNLPVSTLSNILHKHIQAPESEKSHDMETTIATCQIRFRVEDTGIGMTAEQMEKIFLPFEQVGNADRKSEGTGLGLAISQRIVELMGGSLNVESRWGEGSVFWVDLSFPIGKQQEIDRSPQQVIGMAGRKPLLLIVDDDDETRAIAAALLQPIGFSTIEAADGKTGIELAIDQSPDLIMTDLTMPVMDGLEMIRQIRQHDRLSQMPIIVSSASVFESDRQRSLEAGGNGFLPKPIQMDELLRLLQAHLQVEWIYENAVTTPLHKLDLSQISLPNPTFLQELQHLALMGNLEEIKRQISPLRQDPQLLNFANELYQLAERFQVKKIRELLKSWLTAEHLR
jgi:CHASE2 domain-containing sensor protein/nitrogen-specific signal transduction histidine kinase/DNA-binding NarL/FixJ family response regulator